jgi:hypothetical protein
VRIRITWGNSDKARDIANVDIDLRNVRLAVSQEGQPLPEARPSAAGIDDEITRDRLLCPIIRSHNDTGDPLVAVR